MQLSANRMGVRGTGRFGIVLFLCVSVFLVISGCAGTSAGGDPLEVAPGTIESTAHPDMPKVLAAAAKVNPDPGDVVIYYYRADGNYEPWGFWLWAPGPGDGAKNWEMSQHLEVVDGVGYFRFRADGLDIGESAVNANGELGFIRRPDGGWEGQTPDFVWNIEQKGNQVVYFEGAAEPLAVVEDASAEIRSAKAENAELLLVELSGRLGLTGNPSPNGFTLTDGEGRRLPIADVVNARSVNNRSRNFASSLGIRLGAALDPLSDYSLSHPGFLAPVTVDMGKIRLAAVDQKTPASDYELGALYNAAAGSVEFRLWAPFASVVEAQLYSQSIAEAPSAPLAAVVPMTQDEATGVWTGTFSDQDPEGWFYTYKVVNQGLEKIVLDPYAKGMDVFITTGTAGRGAIVDQAKTLPDGGWGNAEFAVGDSFYKKRTDAIIYEIHVRDLTIAPDSGVRGQKGSYAAFIEKLPYLRDLGITHIQLLPVQNFFYTNELDTAYEDGGTTGNNNYNWGYDPHNWFTPEGHFASDPTDPYVRIRELKNLIKAIHQNGMRVLLDVVYNHMASTFLYEDIVPGYYFRRNAAGGFTSNSGVGNDYASSRKMARELIVDSIEYWVREYKVDGFRFDLMGLIDSETILEGQRRAAALRPDILFQGEGWKMYNGPAGTVGTDQNFMDSTDVVAVFNDEIRDLIKGGGFNEEVRAFITGGNRNAEILFKNLIGQPQSNYTADDPGDSMIYIAAHDGLTLHDSIAHNARIDEKTAAGQAEIAQRAKLGNFLVLTGQGLAFLHGGQERGRSKPNVANNTNETIGRFVRNSYDSADNINQIVWTLEPAFQELYEYTRGLIALRRAHSAFRLGSMAAVNAAAEYMPQAGQFQLAYKLNTAEGAYFVVMNSGTQAQTFELGSDLAGAEVFVDRIQASASPLAGPQGVALSGSRATLDPLTATVIRVR